MAARTHRVLLVRPDSRPHRGSDLLGHDRHVDAPSGPLLARRAATEAMGEAYRALRAAYPAASVAVDVVDPRNTAGLVPSIWRDGARAGLPWRDRLAAVREGSGPCAVLVDGRVVWRGVVPDPTQVLACVRAAIGPPA